MNRSMVFWATIGLLLVLAVILWFVLVKPEITRLGDAADVATEEARGAAQSKGQAAGPAYEKGVKQFADLRAQAAQEVDSTRASLATALLEWFPEMKIPAGAGTPVPEEFQRAYAFHCDRFVQDLREALRKAGGPASGDLKLLKPTFLTGAAPPEAEILKWQRIANIERRLLLVAAKNGAAPTREMLIETESAPPDDPDPTYERMRVQLAFAVTSSRLSRLTHGLLSAFDDAGGVCRLKGFSLRPHGEDVIKAAGDDPPMLVAITLSLGFPTPKAVGTNP